MIELEDLPELHEPVMIAAFEGWNDAGEAASAVIEHLADVWRAEPVAAMDPEEYYDFQVNRPRVVQDGNRRRISWRTTRILVAKDTSPRAGRHPRPGDRAVVPVAGVRHRAHGARRRCGGHRGRDTSGR